MHKTFFPLEGILQYTTLEQLLETVSKIPQKEKAPQDAEETTLEEEVEENLQLEREVETPQLRYSFSEEQFIMEQAYNAPGLNYEKKWYKEGAFSQFGAEEEYEAVEAVAAEAEREILNSEEAKETMVEIQYAVMMGSPHQVDQEKLEKLSLFILFNISTFKLIESACGLSRDVDYSPLV